MHRRCDLAMRQGYFCGIFFYCRMQSQIAFCTVAFHLPGFVCYKCFVCFERVIGYFS